MDRIEISGLNIGIAHSDKMLVQDVSFTVDRGKAIGIVGESGSGKTLTAMSVPGLLPNAVKVKSGSILLHKNGVAMDLLSMDEPGLNKIRGKNIAVIFQEPLSSLNPTMKCGPQVAEVINEHNRMPYKEVRQRVLGLMDEVELPHPQKVYNSYPFQLSGGQQQRLMIAMALANNPDYIIADEPTTALDVLVQKKIMGLLVQLKEKYGLGMVFISHDIDLVANMCSRLVVMKQGRIVEQGETHQVVNHPSASYTRALIGCRPRLSTPDKRLLTIQGEMEDALGTKKFATIDYTASPLLLFNNVNLYYETGKTFWGKPKNMVWAVKNASFEIYRGETLGIVGGSGSGKSTLGKAVIRLIEKIKGDIIFEGVNIATLDRKGYKAFRKKIQLVFQDPYGSLNPKQKIGNALLETAKKYDKKANEDTVHQLLKEVKLDADYFHRYPHELSGGQRQRVVIARALALKPELLICDESVSALDVSVQAEILNLLNEIKSRQNLTLMFISHDLSVVKYMGHRVLVLKDGEIQEISLPGQLFSDPKSAYTQQLIDAIPKLENVVRH
jgi:peptide/nickel transport system ATP-binding protein